MELKNFLLLLGFVVFLISYIKYNEIVNISNSSKLNEVNVKNKNFKFINTSFPIEHIVKINDELLICSGFRYPEIFIGREYLTEHINNGALFLYNTKTNEFKQVYIENYPNKIPFHPHGISLYKISMDQYYLFVINHSVKSNPYDNEERIEKILITIDFKKKNNKEKISLVFKNTVTLPQNYFGTLNSLAIINLETIYFTTQNYFPLPSYLGNNADIMNYLYLIKYKLLDICNILFQKLNLKKTYLYSYNWNNGKINLIQNSEGLSNHGLAYNADKSILYMARSFEKDIKVFEISRNDPTKALLINTVKTIYNIRNIFYDNEKEKIYAGIFGSNMEIIHFENSYIKDGDFENVTSFGGFEEIDVANNYEISDIILMKNEIKGVSSAIKILNDIYLSSTYQNDILIYQRK